MIIVAAEVKWYMQQIPNTENPNTDRQKAAVSHKRSDDTAQRKVVVHNSVRSNCGLLVETVKYQSQHGRIDHAVIPPMMLTAIAAGKLFSTGIIEKNISTITDRL